MNLPGHEMDACNHEEGDTWLFVHVRDAVENNAKNIRIRTFGTDVVVIAIAQFSALSLIQPELNVWIAFGMRKHFRYLSVNSIHEGLGERKAKALPFFRAFTGSDTTSAFQGRENKTAWDAWNAYSEATDALIHVRDKHSTHSCLQLSRGSLR